MSTFDPRVTAARPDLAARYLEGKVDAVRFVDGVVREVIEPQTPLRQAPSPDEMQVTEALKGEHVTVYEETEEGWCWGQLGSDGYVGWLSANALRAPGPAPTHRVSALRTLVFPAPSIKVPPLEALPLGGLLAVARMAGDFAVTAAGGYVPARHLAPIGSHDSDFVDVAVRFLGTPYLWGGKTSLGIDCSGLVQVALTAAGVGCPRDSDMQEQALGAPVDATANFSNLRRGDLLFWPGHVAIARDGAHIVHANAFHMAVVEEPLAQAVRRIAAAGSALRGVRRLS